MYGAASPDHLAFEVCDSRQSKLGRRGLLAPGLVIFGDNAYVNTFFMVMPYPNMSKDTDQDHYNVYHSQLRITIEGAFGLLAQRWGMLRKQMPKNYSIQKIMSCVSCLCRLHNYLIQVEDGKAPKESHEEDNWNLAVSGPVPIGVRNGICLPLQLLDAGHHHDEIYRIALSLSMQDSSCP